MEELTRSREAYDAPVDALVAEGNEVEGDRWQCDKEGYHTYMRHPIDWRLVRS